MRRSIAMFVLTLLSAVSNAGPISEQFLAGYYGVPWGSSLDHLVGTFPQGDHAFATTPGHRAYWVKDGEPVFSVPRDGQGVLYGIGKRNELVSVTVGYSYDRKDELIGMLISLFGAYDAKGTEGTEVWFAWKPDQGVRISVRASSEPTHGIVWLTILGPNHKARERCP